MPEPSVAFVVQKFPLLSEVFIIDQVADLLDRGVDVTIFCFERGDTMHVSDRYRTYRMWERTHLLGMPNGRIARVWAVIPRALRLGFYSPRALLETCNAFKYGRHALSLQLLFACAPFVGRRCDVIHCHFGKLANQYLRIRRILKHTMPMVTSFYGYDISAVPRAKGAAYYDELKRQCHAFIVMSADMKRRVIALGFPEKEIAIVPVSITVDRFPFIERTLHDGERVEILSVGRFVEKKGFDDLLRALAIVKERTAKPFRATIVGGGPLEPELKRLADDLHLGDVVRFAGYMRVQDIIATFLKSHVYVQPSKTASNGDME